MFGNKFTKNDPLVEAVKGAMQDGEIRRQAEAFVNEEFGVYSRKAVVREQLASYDAALEEVYKCMKEEDKKNEKKKEDKPKSDYSKMREKMVGKGKDLETTRKIVGEAKKLADKDYDKDGKIESPKDEVWGSRFRAAKMAGKMEEAQIDEVSTEKLVRYRNKAGEGREKGSELAYAKLTGKAKVKASMPKTPYMEETDYSAQDRAPVTKSAPKEDPSTPKVPMSQLPKPGNAAGSVLAKARDALRESQIDEAAYSAKAAREGKDIGKPGKMFSKIASKAGKKYGSKERGKAVAGAILKRIRAKHMEEQTQIDELSAFGAEFAAARKAGLSQFRSKVTGQMTSTALKGQSKSPSAAKPASSLSKSTSGMTADVAASRTSGGSLPSMATSGTPSRVSSSAENKAASNVVRDKGPSMTRQYSFPGSTVAPPRADMDSKTPRNPASAADVSGMDKMKAMSNLKSDTPTTPGSMKISAQPAPITGPSGTDKMKTMASLKEEVQVGENKYRIV